MQVDKKKIGEIVRGLEEGTGQYRVNGKTTDGARWPEGNHYYIVDDLMEQKTYHVPADELKLSKYSYADPNGTEWTFSLGKHINGGDILTVTSTVNGESTSQWTTDLLSLPKSEEEAAEYLNELDWAVGQSDVIVQD